MNILITSAGRRGYIVEYFKKALNGSGKVYVGNSSSFSSAFSYADETVITPLIYDKDYIPFLLEFCKKKDITVVLSLFDVDLLVLSRNKELFKKNNITVVVSEEKVIEVCNDKWATYNMCKGNGILTAQTFIDLEEAEDALNAKTLKFPVIIKPRWGMGSLAIYQADTFEELNVLYKKCKKDILKTYLKYEAAVDSKKCVIIQEKLQGQEYGVDIINDLSGKFCCNVVRKKYAMRAGETDCAVVVKNTKVDDFAKKIGGLLGHAGNLDMDIFLNGESIYLLEMNARFGGGYPFSYFAGVDLPEAIIKWLNGEDIGEVLTIKQYDRVIQKGINFVDITEFIL